MSKTTAREFLDQIADSLRAKGREVEVTETQEPFGTFVWLSTVAPRWYDSSIHLSARYSDRTKRWALGELQVRRSSDVIVKTTRTSIRIAADVYA